MCLGSHDTPRVGGLGATMLLPPLHPGLFPRDDDMHRRLLTYRGGGVCCGAYRPRGTSTGRAVLMLGYSQPLAFVAARKLLVLCV
jgi:hypothetical protein